MKALSRLAPGFAVALMVLALPSRAAANGIVPTCVDGATLATYIALGSTGCTVGDKHFYDFEYELVFAGDATPIPATSVIVNTITGPDIGLQFEGEWYSTFFGQLVQSLDYTVATTSGSPLIIGNTLSGELYAGNQNAPFAQVIEQKCLGAALGPAPLYSCSGIDEALNIFDDDVNPPVLTDSVSFTAVSIIGVHNTIRVFGSTTGQAEVDLFRNTFTQTDVPEPGLLALMLAGAGAVVRRRRRSA